MAGWPGRGRRCADPLECQRQRVAGQADEQGGDFALQAPQGRVGALPGQGRWFSERPAQARQDLGGRADALDALPAGQPQGAEVALGEVGGGGLPGQGHRDQAEVLVQFRP